MPELTLIVTKITRDNYDKAALQFSQDTAKAQPKSLPVLTLGSPECDAWMRYFEQYLGYRSWAVKALKLGSIKSMTVPAQWPEWFDPEYARRQEARLP